MDDKRWISDLVRPTTVPDKGIVTEAFNQAAAKSSAEPQSQSSQKGTEHPTAQLNMPGPTRGIADVVKKEPEPPPPPPPTMQR